MAQGKPLDSYKGIFCMNLEFSNIIYVFCSNAGCDFTKYLSYFVVKSSSKFIEAVSPGKYPKLQIL